MTHSTAAMFSTLRTWIAARTPRQTRSRHRSARLIVPLLLLPISAFAIAQSLRFDIPAQPLPAALKAFADQARIQLLYKANTVQGSTGNAVVGDFDTREALQILLRGTGLEVVYSNDSAATIRWIQQAAKPTAAVPRTGSLRLAQAEPSPAEGERQAEDRGVSSAEETGSASRSDSLAELVVTGTRIARQEGYTAPTPVTVLSTDELVRKTPTNIPDALNQLPQFLGSISQNAQADTGASRPRSGNFLDLRALGPQRVLILQDGRRVPPTSSNGATDANLIPQMLVERVEIVTGGASAAYGSDAVSGVVNFIIDKNFEGVKGIAQYGASTYGDNNSYRLGAAGGISLLDGRLHLVGSAERFESDGIENRASRYTSSGENTETGLTIGGFGTAAQPYVYVRNARLNTQSYGGLISNGPLAGMQFLPGGQVGPFTPGTPIPGRPGYGIGGDGAISPSRGRTGVPSLLTEQAFGYADYDVTESLALFAQVSYAEGKNTDFNTSSLSPFSGTTIFRENAFLPDNVRALVGATPSFNILRPFAEWDVNRQVQESRNVVATGGLKGTLANGAYDWTVYYTTGDSTFRTNSYQLHQPRYFAAVDAVRDPAGNIVCNITLTHPGRMDNCIPLNVLGAGASSQRARDFVHGNSIWQAVNNMEITGGELTGQPFELWAGPVAAAIGAEYRHQSIDQTSNSDPAVPVDFTGIRGVTNRNQFIGVNVGTGAGSYSVKEAYGELAVPLAKDSAIGDLELNGAVRYTDYSTSGPVVTWKLGTSYRPIEDIHLRGTVSRDIRAPSLFDFYAGRQQTTSPLTDLHTGVSSATNVISSGNIELEPEEADTYTIGIALSPSFAEGLNLSIDYYNIRIENAIAQPFTYIQMADLCEFSNGTSALCAQIIRPFPFENRSPQNFPTEVRLQNLNLATLHTSGVDLEGNYRGMLGKGAFGLRLLASRLMSYERQNSPESPSLEYAGTADFIQGFYPLPMPKWRGNLETSYGIGDLTVGIQERYIGSFDKSRQFVYVDNKVKETYYTDFNLTYGLKFAASTMQVFMTVNNVFDQKGRLFLISPVSGLNIPISRNVHDVVGRYFTVGFKTSL